MTYTALYNDSGIHSLPAAINMMTNLIFKTGELLAGKGSNSTLLAVNSLPWPTDFEKLPYDNSAMSSIILLAMAFTVIPAGFGIEICRERQVRQ